MKVKDLLNFNDLKLITSNNLNLEKEIKDLYTGDLLSWVMGHIHEDGVCFLTVLNSINIIAVATLLDLPVVIFCENVEPTQDIIDKAEKEGVNLFVSNDTTFHTAFKIKIYLDNVSL